MAVRCRFSRSQWKPRCALFFLCLHSLGCIRKFFLLSVCVEYEVLWVQGKVFSPNQEYNTSVWFFLLATTCKSVRDSIGDNLKVLDLYCRILCSLSLFLSFSKTIFFMMFTRKTFYTIVRISRMFANSFLGVMHEFEFANGKNLPFKFVMRYWSSEQKYPFVALKRCWFT